MFIICVIGNSFQYLLNKGQQYDPGDADFRQHDGSGLSAILNLLQELHNSGQQHYPGDADLRHHDGSKIYTGSLGGY